MYILVSSNGAKHLQTDVSVQVYLPEIVQFPDRADHRSTIKTHHSIILNIYLTRAQFHQCSTDSFYAHRAQKHKKGSQVISLFMLLGSTLAKATRKYVGEIDSNL